MNERKQVVLAGLSGVIFSIGLVLAGMTRPGKVVAFLDFFGDWDPSLAFVMGGAATVYLLTFQGLAKKRDTPLVAPVFHLPTRKDIDVPLIVGGGLFGIGWGLGGFCPGPALSSLGTGSFDVATFVVAMFAGMGLRSILKRRSAVHDGSTQTA